MQNMIYIMFGSTPKKLKKVSIRIAKTPKWNLKTY